MDQWKDAALKSAVHIDKKVDLPGNNEPKTFVWEGGSVTLKSTEARVVLLLMRKTLYCASRINWSACIDRLRHRHGLPIVTYHYQDKHSSGRFGVYALGAPIQVKG